MMRRAFTLAVYTRLLPAAALLLLGIACLPAVTPPPPSATSAPAEPQPGAPAESPAHPRLILVSWDGAADWAVDRLLAEGALPHLARLSARGVRAEWSVTSFPSKTAVGHAAAYTGAWPATSGVASNNNLYLRDPARSLLETRSGFSSENLTAEPLFVTAARAGRRVAVLSATQSYPEGPHVARLTELGILAGGSRPATPFAAPYFSVSGFEHRIAARRMFEAGDLQPVAGSWPVNGGAAVVSGSREILFEVGETSFAALVFDDPRDPTVGLDTVLIRRGGRAGDSEIRLKPREAGSEGGGGWSPPFAVRRGALASNTYFRLFELAADGSRLALYQREVSGLRGAASAEEIALYQQAYPGFHDDPFFYYQRGGFGPPLMLGGDGTAEERALDLARHDTELLIAGSRWAWRTLRPDALFHYSPIADSAGHAWVGLLDPASPLHDAELAARLWPFYRATYRELDRWLGALMELGGEDTIIALFSDHGMHGVGWNFHVNTVLENAGLLARHPASGQGEDGQEGDERSGEIDLARTRALSPPGNEFAVWVNATDRPEGIVAPEHAAAVLGEVEKVLLAARDPRSGRPLVRRVFRPSEAPGLGLAGPPDGVLYIDPAPGYYPRTSASATIIAEERQPWGSGQHGYWPQRRDMHAIFFAAGPGLPAGVLSRPIRHIDIAPTLASLLGIPAPEQAEGHELSFIRRSQ